MFRALLPVAILFATEVSAQSRTSCNMTSDDTNCNRIVACIGSEGEWFNGRAFGRGEGTFSGATSGGVPCAGNWMSRNAIGVGQADVFCDDGRTGRVYFTYQDSYTGTALGQGAMTSGQGVRMWSGNNVLAYLRGDTGERIAMLPCDGGDIPIS